MFGCNMIYGRTFVYRWKNKNTYHKVKPTRYAQNLKNITHAIPRHHIFKSVNICAVVIFRLDEKKKSYRMKYICSILCFLLYILRIYNNFVTNVPYIFTFYMHLQFIQISNAYIDWLIQYFQQRQRINIYL